jgi:hypothetical protein
MRRSLERMWAQKLEWEWSTSELAVTAERMSIVKKKLEEPRIEMAA